MGGDSGYIDARTLRRVREQRPELGTEQLVALYLEAIPERTVAGSCVFHGERGCALPRSLRSRVCNDFYCLPLRQWLARPVTSTATAVVVFQEEQVLRSRLI